MTKTKALIMGILIFCQFLIFYHGLTPTSALTTHAAIYIDGNVDLIKIKKKSL